MKKVLPPVLALLVFLAAFSLLNARQEKKSRVVVAAVDMPAGHTLQESDLTLIEAPESRIPDGAVDDPAALVGETLRVDRTAGDYVTRSHIGGQNVALAPNERAVAVEVTDSAGLAGLLKPGDLVGITAVLGGSQGGYSKMIAENLRVLYVSPEFRSIDPAAYQQSDSAGGFGAGGTTPDRQNRGVVVLAVPTDAVVVAYDFAPFGVDGDARTINIIDLLPALDQLSNVKLSLFIQPKNAKSFSTSGVSLADLVVTPGPSPTPGPDELQSPAQSPAQATPAPTPTPTP